MYLPVYIKYICLLSVTKGGCGRNDIAIQSAIQLVVIKIIMYQISSECMGVKCMCYTKILYDNFQSMPSVNTIMIAFLNSRYFTGCLYRSRPSCLWYRISPRSETGDYRKRRWHRHSLKKVNETHR